MVFSSSNTISFVGFFGCGKASKIVPLSMYFDTRYVKIFSRRFTDTFVTRAVIALLTSVTMVLRRSSLAQINPTIVRLVFVYMIYFKFGPSAFHIKPSQTMGHVFFTFYSYFYTTFGLLPASNFSRVSASAQRFYPNKFTRTWIVAEHRAQFFCSQVLMRIFRPTFHGVQVNPVGGFVKVSV